MTFVSGVADGPHDLLDKIVSLVTSEVLQEKQWTVERDQEFTDPPDDHKWAEREVILKGPGSGEDKEFWVGILLVIQRPEQWNIEAAYFRIKGFTGFDPEADFFRQPGSGDTDADEEEAPGVCLSLGRIPYWMTANNRRLIMGAMPLGYPSSMYLGYILPYGDPGEFSYPLAYGGDTRVADDTDTHWVQTPYSDFPRSSFFRPIGDVNEASLWVHRHSSDKGALFQGVSVTDDAQSDEGYNVWPYYQWAWQHPEIGRQIGLQLSSAPDGTRPMSPVVIHDNQVAIGELDGVCVTAADGGVIPGDEIEDRDGDRWFLVASMPNSLIGLNDYMHRDDMVAVRKD